MFIAGGLKEILALREECHVQHRSERIKVFRRLKSGEIPMFEQPDWINMALLKGVRNNAIGPSL
jgi:hypothetical protein